MLLLKPPSLPNFKAKVRPYKPLQPQLLPLDLLMIR
jgi:hypothetical protein